MPVLSMFFGILIKMNWKDNDKHHLPHFHAYYNEFEASFDLNSEEFSLEEIIYGQPLLPRAVSVEALPNFMLKIKFTSNEERFFDVKKIYHLPCFVSLKNKEFFKNVRIEHGSVAWNNDIDYCPDCLYEESTPSPI